MGSASPFAIVHKPQTNLVSLTKHALGILVQIGAAFAMRHDDRNTSACLSRKKTESLSRTSTITTRDSNWPDSFAEKFGQCSAPGINSLRDAIIWQPLHTPSAKYLLLGRKMPRTVHASETQTEWTLPNPAPHPEHPPKRETAARGEALKHVKMLSPGLKIRHRHIHRSGSRRGQTQRPSPYGR